MPGRKVILGPLLAVLFVAVLAGCSLGTQGPSQGFRWGDDFSYMADTSEDSKKLALIAGEIASNGEVTGELQIVEVSNGAVGRESTEFTGAVAEDGTAVFQGIASDGSDVMATLDEENATLTLDKEVGIAASGWHRASLPAFNSEIQDAARQ